MKIIQQVAIIVSFYYFGELVAGITRIPVPGSVIGMTALFLALASGKLKIDRIRESVDFFLDNLTVLFLPPVIGLIDAYAKLQSHIIPILTIVVVGTVFILLVTGYIVQAMIVRMSHD